MSKNDVNRNHKDGINYLLNKNYKEAERCFTIGAKQGHANSQYELAMLYNDEDDNEVPNSEELFLYWLTKAVDNDHSEAKIKYDLFKNGNKVNKQFSMISEDEQLSRYMFDINQQNATHANNRLNEFIDDINAKREEFDEFIDGTSQEFNTQMDASVFGFRDTINAKRKELDEFIDEASQKFNTQLDAILLVFRDNINSATQSIESQTEKIINSLDNNELKNMNETMSEIKITIRYTWIALVVMGLISLLIAFYIFNDLKIDNSTNENVNIDYNIDSETTIEIILPDDKKLEDYGINKDTIVNGKPCIIGEYKNQNGSDVFIITKECDEKFIR